MRERERGEREGGREEEEEEERERERDVVVVVVCWLLKVPATCKYISGTELIRQFYVLSH